VSGGYLPQYVDRGGRQVWRAPYLARHADLYGFILDCDPSAIDELLQRDFVEPSGGAVDYRCAQPSVVILFARIDRLESGDRRDGRRGYISELEVSVWCLAADVVAGGRLLWHLPYVFVDSGQAASSGREVYGYPKQTAEFPPDFPDTLAAPGTTTVGGLAIATYGPDVEAQLHPMISVKRLAAPAGGPAAALHGFDDVCRRFADHLGVDERLPFGPGPQPSAAITPADEPPPRARRAAPPPWAARRILDALQGRSLLDDPTGLVWEMVSNPRLMFLKQFRDVACPSKACYQAIVEAPLDVHEATAGYEPLDPGLFEVTVRDWDSHPMASELGVQRDTPLPVQVAFRAQLDFDVELGFEVWRAPT
jgi:hypothetical protein